ncbi:disease resistance protein RGA2-like isoform X3 [Miscanthus floridulus]|uniref:disease resistance protein RGA2-like isoform X3 n=1 Tax=Miscanthus floridulus TaxID=154761 RepID=UPI00345762C4
MFLTRTVIKESGMSKKQLKNGLEKIEMIINDACQILEHLNLPSVANSNGRQNFPANSCSAVTTGAPPLKVFGRDKERDKVIAMLHKKECDGQQKSKSGIPYSVLGIHGIAGSGKSTLAQVVYAREKKDKQENKVGHFDLVMWVHVSQKFDLDVIFRELMEGATGSPCPTFNSRNALQEKMEEKLHGKRFFLVLDDVWYNNRDARKQEELQQILSPLKVGETGSKILVTSRSRDALLALGSVEERCIPIPDLDDEAFFEMFMHYALGDATIEDNHDRVKLEMLGEDIAKKLKRSPLAARAVGAQLCLRPNVEFWRRTKDRAMLNDTMGALWWSYQHLDEQVRRCFAYCSIFPRRRHLKRKELVQFWMAEGFIKTSNDEEELDGIGQEYFDELLSASFLQLGERRLEHVCEVDYFTIHDLLRDIAEEAARGDCFRIEKDFTGEVPPDVRHLFVGSPDINMVANKISELQNLRTLIFDDHLPPDDEVFQGMFRRFRKLRVLILHYSIDSDGHTFSVPECIGQLKHLRYLRLNGYLGSTLILPSSITKLYHIQLLDVSYNKDVVFSGGKTMHHLVNLRCVSSFVDLDIPNIGRLKRLQVIPNFSVMKKQGFELRQLKDLNKLEGRLQISNLENVESKEEAVQASLADKERLTMLELCWDVYTSCSPEVEAEVLEGLCPSKYVERLSIRNYHGSTYPNWMVGKQNGGPKRLHYLWLVKCTRLEPAPELFEVFVHLRCFMLWDSNWPSLPDNIGQLTSLQQLDLWCCPNIRSLPALPRSLELFCLMSCNEEFMRSCETVEDPNWQKIQHIPDKFITHAF